MMAATRVVCHWVSNKRELILDGSVWAFVDTV